MICDELIWALLCNKDLSGAKRRPWGGAWSRRTVRNAMNLLFCASDTVSPLFTLAQNFQIRRCRIWVGSNYGVSLSTTKDGKPRPLLLAAVLGFWTSFCASDTVNPLFTLAQNLQIRRCRIWIGSNYGVSLSTTKDGKWWCAYRRNHQTVHPHK